jgi:diguanylate cyclase (GGDEF)-like protein
MPEAVPKSDDQGKLLSTRTHDWQLWSVFILGLGLIGDVLAFYGFLRAPGSAWTVAGLTQLVPPLLFGLFSLLVLVNLYVVRKEALIQSLQQETIQQKMAAELNQELALHDPVTDVYNRRYLRLVLMKEKSRAQRYGKGLSVMLVDITGFRRVNDSLGHTGGDVVLKQIAFFIQTTVRNSDYVVRFGGDEFLIVLPDTDTAGADLLTRRLKNGLGEWSRHSGMSEFGLRFAIGVAQFSPDRSIDEMLKLAEQRMDQDRQPSDAEKKASHSLVTAPEGTSR